MIMLNFLLTSYTYEILQSFLSDFAQLLNVACISLGFLSTIMNDSYNPVSIVDMFLRSDSGDPIYLRHFWHCSRSSQPKRGKKINMSSTQSSTHSRLRPERPRLTRPSSPALSCLTLEWRFVLRCWVLRRK